MKKNVDVEDFRAWVAGADDDDLRDFIDEVEDVIIDLESNDFFGTEGLNKRFA